MTAGRGFGPGGRFGFQAPRRDDRRPRFDGWRDFRPPQPPARPQQPERRPAPPAPERRPAPPAAAPRTTDVDRRIENLLREIDDLRRQMRR
jgi:hypothetical protein